MDKPNRGEKHTVRRDELLQLAWTMLVQEGFENLTLNGYLARSGVSKGAFYHYFASWESLLEEVIDKVARDTVRALALDAAGRPYPPLEELTRFIGVASTRPAETTQLRGILAQIYQRGEIAFLTRLQKRTDELSLPALERIIEDGIAAGQFETPYPAEVAEAILSEWNRTLLAVFELLGSSLGADPVKRAILRRAEAAAYITEQVLGLAHGTLERVSVDDVERMLLSRAGQG